MSLPLLILPELDIHFTCLPERRSFSINLGKERGKEKSWADFDYPGRDTLCAWKEATVTLYLVLSCRCHLQANSEEQNCFSQEASAQHCLIMMCFLQESRIWSNFKGVREQHWLSGRTATCLAKYINAWQSKAVANWALVLITRAWQPQPHV